MRFIPVLVEHPLWSRALAWYLAMKTGSDWSDGWAPSEGTGGVCLVGGTGYDLSPKLVGWDKTLPKRGQGMFLPLFFKACSCSELVSCKYIRQSRPTPTCHMNGEILGNTSCCCKVTPKQGVELFPAAQRPKSL